jgi:tricarboxylate carrier
MSLLDLIFKDTVPPFALAANRYDQATFYGRWRYFIDLINPSSLFYSMDKVRAAKQLLDNYKAGLVPDGTSDQQLWDARWLTQSVLHPDSGQAILAPFRLSAFIPANIPIMVGILLTKKTTFNIVFWQATNQSWNFGFNYYNRNQSNEFSSSQMAASYVGAVASSVAVALSLDKLIMKHTSGTLLMRTLGPATALAVAGCVNLWIMRYNELLTGIDVSDAEGGIVGKSKQAAWDGLLKTTAIRFGLQYPGAFFPVIATLGVRGLGLYPAALGPRILVDCGMMAATVLTVIPLSQASFPQIVFRPQLEDSLQSNSGFYYNRGV